MSTNKRNNLEFDDMNIKSYLNSSLDKDGINVSEDMINRTLDAIKSRQEADTNIDDNLIAYKHKTSSLNKYTRSFAKVAAAVLLIVVGLGAFKIMHNGTKQSDSEYGVTSDEEDGSIKSYDNSYLAKDDSGSYSEASDQVTDSESSSVSLDMEKDNKDYDSMSMPLDNDEELTDAEDTDDGHEDLNGNETYFLDILSVPLYDVKQITILNESNGMNVVLSERAEIEGFYSMIEGYKLTFIDETEGEGNETLEAYYDLVIVGQDELYLRVIGDMVSINIYDKNIYKNYRHLNQQEFIRELDIILDK